MPVFINLISEPPQPNSIAGNSSVCQGSPQVYSINPVAGATSYTWTLPFGWTGNSSSTSISCTSGNSGGTISVTADNTCGSSTPQTIAVTVVSNPTPVIIPSGPFTVCTGIPTTLSVQSPQPGVTYYWSDNLATGNSHTLTNFNGSLYCYGYTAACGSSSNSNSVFIN